jgi:hypothetical protein
MREYHFKPVCLEMSLYNTLHRLIGRNPRYTVVFGISGSPNPLLCHNTISWIDLDGSRIDRFCFDTVQ